jgi:hypothetical protein
MVRCSPTNHRLGKRMDRLRTITRRHQSKKQANDDENPYRYGNRPANTSFKASRETRRPTLTDSERIPPALIRIQRSRIEAIPATTRVGPRHRAKARPSRTHARESVRPDPTRTRSTHSVPQRTPRQGIHHRVQKPIRGPILLRQKERREAPTSAGLPETQRMDPPKCHTAPTHPRAHRESQRSQPIHQIRHSLGIQQHTNT